MKLISTSVPLPQPLIDLICEYEWQFEWQQIKHVSLQTPLQEMGIRNKMVDVKDAWDDRYLWILVDDVCVVEYDVKRDQFHASNLIIDVNYFHPHYYLTFDNGVHITNRSNHVVLDTEENRAWSWSTFRCGCTLGSKTYLFKKDKPNVAEDVDLLKNQILQHHGNYWVTWDEGNKFFIRRMVNNNLAFDLYQISWKQNRLVCDVLWTRSETVVNVIWFDLFTNGTIVMLCTYKKKSFFATIDVEDRFRYKACNAKKCFCIGTKLVLVFNDRLTIYQ